MRKTRPRFVSDQMVATGKEVKMAQRTWNAHAIRTIDIRTIVSNHKRPGTTKAKTT